MFNDGTNSGEEGPGVCPQCGFAHDREWIDDARARKLLSLWTYRAHRAASAHYHESSALRKSKIRWTTFNAGFAIAVLYVVNADWIANVDSIEFIPFDKQILLGVLSLLVVLTSIYQYILVFSEREILHREAGQEFSNLQRKIERYSLFQKMRMSMIHNVSRDYNHVTKSYPLTSRQVWQNADRSDLMQKIQQLEEDLRNDAAYEPDPAVPFRQRRSA